jgi:hypothetical protein
MGWEPTMNDEARGGPVDAVVWTEGSSTWTQKIKPPQNLARKKGTTRSMLAEGEEGRRKGDSSSVRAVRRWVNWFQLLDWRKWRVSVEFVLSRMPHRHPRRVVLPLQYAHLFPPLPSHPLSLPPIIPSHRTPLLPASAETASAETALHG